MTRRLKVSVETLLSHTTVPEPDLNYAKSAQKQAFMAAIQAKTTKTRKVSAWHFGRSAITFAGIGLFVMIGAGTLLAQAGQARPGHPLYSLNRALERTQLALTQDEADRLALKINFAEERLAEVAAADLSQSEVAAVVATNTARALSEIDDQLDQTKIALELNEPAGLTREQVGQIDARFKQVVETYQLDVAELFQATENTETADEVTAITDVTDGLLSAPIAEGEGYYLRLRGKLAQAATHFEAFGRELSLSGVLDATALAGQAVKVNGWFSGEGLAAEMVEFDDSQLALSLDGHTTFSHRADLQRDATGFFVTGPNEQRVDLTGEVTQDERLAGLVGQEIGFNSTWLDGQAELIQVMVGEGDEVIVIPEIEDPDLTETGESLPATDAAQPDVPPPGFDE